MFFFNVKYKPEKSKILQVLCLYTCYFIHSKMDIHDFFQVF